MYDMRREFRRMDKSDFVQFVHLFYLEQNCTTPNTFTWDDIHAIKGYIRKTVPINREGELFEYNLTRKERTLSLSIEDLQLLDILEEEYHIFTNNHLAKVYSLDEKRCENLFRNAFGAKSHKRGVEASKYRWQTVKMESIPDSVLAKMPKATYYKGLKRGHVSTATIAKYS